MALVSFVLQPIISTKSYRHIYSLLYRYYFCLNDNYPR